LRDMSDKSKPMLFMTHVSYSGGVRASATAFDVEFMAGEDLEKLNINFGRHRSGGSLLAQSFNGAWCTALNMRESGYNIQWFAMLHDDVVPEPNWAKILMEDLHSTGADMVSAIVPVKDPSGVTSTAIDNDGTGDQSIMGRNTRRYSWERRITLKEAIGGEQLGIKGLPDVFNAADCGYTNHHILANTGCWMCRFDRDWVQAEDEHGNKRVYFTINDRIRRDQNTGKWVADVEPEDWFVSRQIQQLGGKIFITQRVKLCHYGLMPFPNFQAFGQGPVYDYAAADHVGHKAIGEPPADTEMHFISEEMPDVRGYLNDTEGRLLAEMASGKKCLEIGSYYGRSTIWMARTAEHVWAVDTWDSWGTGVDTLVPFKANAEKYGVTDKITICGGKLNKVKDANGYTDLSACASAEFGPFDFVFIDGDHTEMAVQEDFDQALPLVVSGGFIAFHDYQRPSDPGVTIVVDRLISRGARIVNRAGTIVVLNMENLHGGATEITAQDGNGHEGIPGSAGGVQADQGGAGQEDCGPASEAVAIGGPAEFRTDCTWL